MHLLGVAVVYPPVFFHLSVPPAIGVSTQYGFGQSLPFSGAQTFESAVQPLTRKGVALVQFHIEIADEVQLVCIMS